MSKVNVTHTDTSSQYSSGDKASTVDDETTPDFTLLPDFIWVEILKFLTVQERYVLSQTCRKLHNLFSSPSVWKFVSFLESDFQHDFSSILRDCLSQWQLSVLEKFGHCIQNLTLETVGYDFDHKSYCALYSLQQWKSLQSFTVHIKKRFLQPTIFHCTEPEQEATHIYNVLSAMYSQTHRPPCAMHIHYSHSELDGDLLELYTDVFQCSASDFRCRRVRSLEIKHASMENCEKLLRINLNPPRSNPTADLVSRFPALQHLSLCENFFSDQLLETLAGMCQNSASLRTLTVQFNSEEDDPLFDLYYKEEIEPPDQGNVVNLSPRAWSRLADACPHLEVFCSFGSFEDVECVIKAEAPLASIRIETKREYRPFYVVQFEEFQLFCFKHSNTLQELVQQYMDTSWRADSELEELPIASVAMQCPKLVDLHYEGAIDRDDIIRLAQLDRKWRRLTIFDYVNIREGQSKRYATREELNELEAMMSQHLGYPWQFQQH